MAMLIQGEPTMTRLFLAALLSAGAASAHAQPPVPATMQPSPDSAQQRKASQKLTACLAEARPRWARAVLARPYLSDGQAWDASRALSGRDSCTRGDSEITFRNSLMVGSLAEYFLRREAERVDSARLAQKLSTLPPRNVTEDFALCVASRNPAAARDLALSEPGSADEDIAARKVFAYVDPCTRETEQLTVDLQALRALVAAALYRGVTAAGTPAS
jgi:hypothetical protein